MVQTHPDLTLRILDGIRGLSQPVRHAAFQVHERRDGQGYPRGRKPMFVSPSAKVIAVADAYTALTADRPWRPAYSGHEAMKVLLADTAAGKFDRAATRGLLDAMSMFPVGTRVGLSDQRRPGAPWASPGANVQAGGGRHSRWTALPAGARSTSPSGQPSVIAVHPDPVRPGIGRRRRQRPAPTRPDA